MGSEENDTKKIEQALQREFPEKPPDSVEYQGERYVHERFLNMYLQSNPAMRKKLDEERRSLQEKARRLDEREKHIMGMEEDVERLRYRLDQATSEAAAAHEELRQYKYGRKSGEYKGSVDGTQIQKVIVDTADIVAGLESTIAQKDKMISELEAELEHLKQQKS